MAKSHYSVKKRSKELARKLKQEQKRQNRLNKDSGKPEEPSNHSQEKTTSAAVETPAP